MRRVTVEGMEVRIESGYPTSRSSEFLRRPGRHRDVLALWRKALGQVADAAGIDRRFSAGFILDDGRMALTADGGDGAVVCINPDRLAEAIEKYGREPLSLAAFLHGVACHELAHLDGRMGHGHDEEFIAAREDLGASTAHTIPEIAKSAACLLGLGPCDVAPSRYEAARQEAVRACEGPGCDRPARHLLPSAKDSSMLHLVTIYSPPGVNAIGSTQVLPLASDVPEGTVHVSDGLDGLTAGRYVVQHGQHDLRDRLVWVFHPSAAAFVYYDGLFLRKATSQEMAELKASGRETILLPGSFGGHALTVSAAPVTPEAAAWLPTPTLTAAEAETLGERNERKIAARAKKQSKDDMRAGTNPILSIPLTSMSDKENVARLIRWRSLDDDYHDVMTDALADIIDTSDDEEGYLFNAAMRAWGYYYDLESASLLHKES